MSNSSKENATSSKANVSMEQNLKRIKIKPTKEQIEAIQQCLDKGELTFTVKKIGETNLPDRGEVELAVVDAQD